MSMMEHFFSIRYAGRSDLFENLSIWKEATYRELQGTYPVIFLSFAGIKGGDWETKKVIILLDEYDTPMQEAYVNGYWDESAAFIRGLFSYTFKTNPYLERSIMTGITRVSRESVFSDLNNLTVVTVISKKYADAFGFTEQEVFQALKEYGLQDQADEVKRWYDGFQFGDLDSVYNPWSITQYLDTKEFKMYWANTSSNRLV